jgi:hypothetical protein
VVALHHPILLHPFCHRALSSGVIRFSNPRQWRSAQLLLGHGGTDYQELSQFLKAVRNKTQTPLDVYDSVVLSVINPLSEKFISEGGTVDCPDFTCGKWKTKKPVFAQEVI